MQLLQVVTIVQRHCGHQEGICQILGMLDLGVISKVTAISNTVYDKVPALGGRWQLILAVIQFPVIQAERLQFRLFGSTENKNLQQDPHGIVKSQLKNGAGEQISFWRSSLWDVYP